MGKLNFCTVTQENQYIIQKQVSMNPLGYLPESKIVAAYNKLYSKIAIESKLLDLFLSIIIIFRFISLNGKFNTQINITNDRHLLYM